MPQTIGAYQHLYVPPSGDDRRTLLMLHGTGGDENDLLPLGRMLAPKAGMLSPRGTVLEHGAPRFFRRLAEGVFDLDDLHARTKDLADFVGEAARVYGFDAGKVVAVGFSNGANIAASLLLSYPRVLHAAALFRAMVPFEPESPIDLSEAKVYIAAGQADPLVPAKQSERLAELLRAAGADVTLDWQPGGHSLTKSDITNASAWLLSAA